MLIYNWCFRYILTLSISGLFLCCFVASSTSFIRAPPIGLSVKLFPRACVNHWWLYHYRWWFLSSKNPVQSLVSLAVCDSFPSMTESWQSHSWASFMPMSRSRVRSKVWRPYHDRKTIIYSLLFTIATTAVSISYLENW